ncbi:MAG: tetratricopeptide repeat protein [Alphaproteobacteria bacterium]
MSEPNDRMSPKETETAPPRRLTLQQGVDLALQHHGAGNLSRAEGLYRRILQADPEHPVALQMLGVIAHQLGKHDVAVGLIARALARKPDDAGAHFNLGLARQALGRLEDAVASYQKAIELQPEHAEALYNLGNALTDLGRCEEAAESYRRVTALKPDFAEAHGNLGTMLAELGRLDEAAASYRKALALKPDDAEAHNNLGMTLAELGRLDEAATSYRKALALKPGFADAWFNLHTTLYAAGDMEPAAQCLEEALRIAPDHRMSRFFLGMLRDHQGHEAAAARHFAALPTDSEFTDYALDSWHYVKSVAGAQARLLGETSEGLALGLDAARNHGLVLEFGVRFGTSLRQIAVLAKQEVHGFDTFQGLPEAWRAMPAGSYSTQGELPEVPPNVRLHVGLFKDALPPFLARFPGPLRFVNVDCDLYSSATTVLDLLAERIVPGTVIAFDEYLFNPHWREDEFKAFQEAVAKYGWRYEYLAVSLFAKQAVVVIR